MDENFSDTLAGIFLQVFDFDGKFNAGETRELVGYLKSVNSDANFKAIFDENGNFRADVGGVQQGLDGHFKDKY